MIFDFIYQSSKTHRLIIIVAFKYFYEQDFNYDKTKDEIFAINKICNEYYDQMIKC